LIDFRSIPANPVGSGVFRSPATVGLTARVAFLKASLSARRSCINATAGVLPSQLHTSLMSKRRSRSASRLALRFCHSLGQIKVEISMGIPSLLSFPSATAVKQFQASRLSTPCSGDLWNIVFDSINMNARSEFDSPRTCHPGLCGIQDSVILNCVRPFFWN